MIKFYRISEIIYLVFGGLFLFRRVNQSKALTNRAASVGVRAGAATTGAIETGIKAAPYMVLL